MNCHELELRLYDEDCRKALLGRAPVPQDVADHLGGCATCRRTWSEAAADTIRLTRDLPLEPPPSVAALPLGGGSATPSLRAMVGWVELGWAVTAGAVFATLGALLPWATPLWQWTGFWVGAACGLAAAVLDREGADLLPGGVRLWT